MADYLIFMFLDETSIGDAFKKTFRYFNEDKHYSKKYGTSIFVLILF